MSDQTLWEKDGYACRLYRDIKDEYWIVRITQGGQKVVSWLGGDDADEARQWAEEQRKGLVGA